MRLQRRGCPCLQERSLFTGRRHQTWRGQRRFINSISANRRFGQWPDEELAVAPTKTYDAERAAVTETRVGYRAKVNNEFAVWEAEVEDARRCAEESGARLTWAADDGGNIAFRAGCASSSGSSWGNNDGGQHWTTLSTTLSAEDPPGRFNETLRTFRSRVTDVERLRS